MRDAPHITILGQGLAGTALGWHLRWRGIPFEIIDRGDVITASRIAAGLITPITGQRLAVDPHFDEQYRIAAAFYRRVDAETGISCFHEQPAVRIVRNRDEQNKYLSKRELQGRIQPVTLSEILYDAPLGAYEATGSARLDVEAYLAASRSVFDVEVKSTSQSSIFVDCTGIAALREGRLPPGLFQPAKGEILTLHIPGFDESRVIHHDAWLVRIGEELYRAGATYSWQPLDDVPTDAGREEIVRRVRTFLKRPFTVVAHEAATRPISADRQPIVQQLSPSQWAFNGLGSKGVLWAPSYAERLAERLSTPPRLTERVHQLLQSVLRPDDIAIDATAGNGHDTLLLASLAEKVYSFDIQPEALEITRQRLQDAKRGNVTLIHADHAGMEQYISEPHRQKIGAIVFNLGYLPGGNQSIITKLDSTKLALEASMNLLRPGGVLTVMTYLGHAGGVEEDEAVRRMLPTAEIVSSHAPSGPRLYVFRK